MTIQEFISSPQKMFIHCRNAQEYEKLCIELDNAGATWCSGKRYWDSTSGRPRDDYDFSHTSMSNKGTCVGIEWAREFSRFKIIPFEEIEFANPETQVTDIGLLINSRTIIGKKFLKNNSAYSRTIESIIINKEGVFVIDENKMRHKIGTIAVL